MAKLTINVGATANDRQGDSLRGAFQKINANFSELYTALGLNSDTTLNLGAFQFTGSVMDTTDSSAITIDQAVTVSSNLTVGGDILPSSDLGANLGSPTNRFKDLFLSGNTIAIGDQTISATSTGISTSGNLSIGAVTLSAVGNSLNIPGISELRFKPYTLEDLRSLNGASFFNSDTTVANSVIVDRLTYLIATDATYAPLKSVGYIPSSYIATFDGSGNITAVAVNIPRFYPEEPGFTTLESINTDLIALDPDTDINDWDSIASSGQAVTLYVGINSESQPFSPAAASLSFYDLTITPTTLAGYGITDAFDGAYSSLSGAPEIPTDVGDLTDIGGLLSGGDGVVEGSTYKIDIAGDDSTLLIDSTNSKIVGYVENDRFNVDGNDYQVRIGVGAGSTTQGTDAIAIGEGAGNYQQGTRSIAIGRGSGNADQGLSAVGIGFCAGGAEQGDYAIAIGFKAGRGPMAGDPDPAQPNNSIIINASGDKLNGTNSGLYIDPVREDTGNIAKAVYYNTTTKELTYADPTDGANLVSENDINITINSPDSTTYTWNFNELGRIEIPDSNNQVAGYIGDIYENGGLILQSVAGGYVELTTGNENVGFYVEELSPGADPLVNPEAVLYTTNANWDFYRDGSTKFPGSIDLNGQALKKSSTLEERTGGVGSAPGNVAVLNNYRHMTLNNQIGTVLTGNFTVNFTSVDLPSDYTARFSVFLRQGATGYYPNVFQINDATLTLVWENGTPPTPTNSAGVVDLFEFLVYGSGIVLGRMRSYS